MDLDFSSVFEDHIGTDNELLANDELVFANYGRR
jgi:hypothetical protein